MYHYSFVPVDLVSDNLSKLKNLLWDASPDWYGLGLELGIHETALKVIKRDNPNDTAQCFTDMLSKWLMIVAPKPTWEGLIAALKQPSIKHRELAKKVKKELGIDTGSDDSDEASGKNLKTSFIP